MPILGKAVQTTGSLESGGSRSSKKELIILIGLKN
jgi:hypothetical protein